MFHDHMELSELIGSRICHDLISPLGAISNGLELLSMTGVEESPELELIAQSIANANSKIRFFRIAYGRAPEGTRMARGEILSVLADYFQNARVSIEWTPATELPRREVKLAFLAIQCLESAMPYGGTITIALDGKDWELRAEARKLKIDAELWASVEGGVPLGEVCASDVQFAVLLSLCRERRTRFATMLGDSEIVMRF